MNIDMSTLSPAQSYATITQTIVPRPVAWVLTENDSASHNLAPFSYFNAISGKPPLVILSVGEKPEEGLKDTRYNLEQRGHCVIHIAHRELAQALNASSATLERGVSEVSDLGLETVDMPGSKLPRLADCRVAYYATLVDSKSVNRQWVAFLELKHLYLAPEIIGKDQKGRRKVMADKLDPIARLGGGEYLLAGDIINIERPG